MLRYNLWRIMLYTTDHRQVFLTIVSSSVPSAFSSKVSFLLTLSTLITCPVHSPEWHCGLYPGRTTRWQQSYRDTKNNILMQFHTDCLTCTNIIILKKTLILWTFIPPSNSFMCTFQNCRFNFAKTQIYMFLLWVELNICAWS